MRNRLGKYWEIGENIGTCWEKYSKTPWWECWECTNQQENVGNIAGTKLVLNMFWPRKLAKQGGHWRVACV